MKKTKYARSKALDYKSNFAGLYLFFSVIILILIVATVNLYKFNINSKAASYRRNACDVRTTKAHDDIRKCRNNEEKKLKKFGQIAKITSKYNEKMICTYFNNLTEGKQGYVYKGNNDLIEAGDDIAGYNIVCRKNALILNGEIREFWYKPCIASGCKK